MTDDQLYEDFIRRQEAIGRAQRRMLVGLVIFAYAIGVCSGVTAGRWLRPAAPSPSPAAAGPR